MEQLIQAAPLMRKPSEPPATRHVPLNTKRSAGAACNRGVKENHALPANFGRASVPIMASRDQHETYLLEPCLKLPGRRFMRCRSG
jgi:hypothetical protein